MIDELEKVEKLLRSKGLSYQKGKGGILVLPVEGGFRLVNLNKEGKIRGSKQAQIDEFKNMFPSLKEQLVVNAESRRRADNLIERQKNMASVHAESFDTNAPKMPAINTIDASKTSDIPRYYGLVDDVGGDKYIVSIFASELPIATAKGGVRPDEAMLQFEVEKKKLDIAKIKSGQITLKDALATVEAKNVRLIYFDDNNPIKGSTRLKHMSKTLKTLAAWCEFLTNDIKFTLVGNIFVHAEDYYGLPTVERTSSGTNIKRFGPESFKSNKGTAGFYLSAYLESTTVDGTKTFRAVTKGISVRIMGALVTADRQVILQRCSEALDNIGKALKALKHVAS